MTAVGLRLHDASRAEFDGGLTKWQLIKLARQKQIKVLQCAVPVGRSVWTTVNRFLAFRPDVELRVYAHYSGDCDLRFARHLTNVRRFAADSLLRAKNVEALADLPPLESLSLGVFELDSFAVLERIPPTLTSLSLGATKSKKPDLAALDRFASLNRLYLEGHSKGIDVLRRLRGLEDVTLRSITTGDLEYLAPLSRLQSLDIKLGGIRSFDGIEGKESIQYLELWQIRGLRDMGIVSKLPGLQNLFAQSLPNIESFPSVARSMMLRRVCLQNLKRMRDFSALADAPSLEEFALFEGSAQTPEQLLPILTNAGVRRVRVGFGSDRKNRTFSRLREEHGKSELDSLAPFEYE